MTCVIRPAPIDKELYKQLRHHCIDNEITPRDALEEAVRLYLRNFKAKGGRT